MSHRKRSAVYFRGVRKWRKRWSRLVASDEPFPVWPSLQLTVQRDCTVSRGSRCIDRSVQAVLGREAKPPDRLGDECLQLGVLYFRRLTVGEVAWREGWRTNSNLGQFLFFYISAKPSLTDHAHHERCVAAGQIDEPVLTLPAARLVRHTVPADQEVVRDVVSPCRPAAPLGVLQVAHTALLIQTILRVGVQHDHVRNGEPVEGGRLERHRILPPGGSLDQKERMRYGPGPLN